MQDIFTYENRKIIPSGKRCLRRRPCGSAQTPLRDDAFAISNDQKIELIQEKVAEILHTLGMDLTDDSLKGTPKG